MSTELLDPEFLDFETILEIHEEQIRLFGGDSGVLNAGAAQAAVDAPINLYLYEVDTDIFDLAASYCYHLAKNHPFVDGNKRTGLSAAIRFLTRNNIDFTRRSKTNGIFLSNEYLAAAVEALVTDFISENEFADMLFFAAGPAILNDRLTLAGERANRLAPREFNSPEEEHAYRADAFMTFVADEMRDLCSTLRIKGVRIAAFTRPSAQALIEGVDPHYQRVFGMVVSQDDETER